MYLPPIQKHDEQNIYIGAFGGYDERDKIADGSFSDMKNMSSDGIPALTNRRPRKLVAEKADIKKPFSPENVGGELTSFTGVAGNKFYYNGAAIDNITLSDSPKSIADFNGNICIFPDKVYYSYLPDPDSGTVTQSLKPMGKTLKLSGASFHSSLNEITGEYSAYILKSGADFDENFSEGDSIVISGCSEHEDNNTFIADSKTKYASDDRIISVVVSKASASRLDVVLYNKRGAKALFDNGSESGEITIEVYIPDMSYVCVHNNRLWGASENGEYIYASKLGDCFNFNSFQGLGNDSWYSMVGTDGKFTGIVSYRTCVVAFKQNYIHHIYGDSPLNFSMPKQTFGGTPDGDSIAEVGGYLYYLGADGFYIYGGGEPDKISYPIKKRYVSCKAGTDGRKYIVSAKTADGKYDVLVYTPDYNIWHREDDADFVGFARYNGELYAADSSALYKLRGGEEPVSWCVVSRRFTKEDMDFKGLSAAYIRLDLKTGTSAKICISYDGGDFIHCGDIEGEGFFVHRIPIRFSKCDSFRIMLEGVGDAVVHELELITYTGGITNEYRQR